MQTLADVLQKPIKVVTSEQACALGSAMCAAVASGIYPSLEAAQKAMSSGFDKTYQPNLDRAEVYEKLYEKYVKLGLNT